MCVHWLGVLNVRFLDCLFVCVLVCVCLIVYLSVCDRWLDCLCVCLFLNSVS